MKKNCHLGGRKVFDFLYLLIFQLKRILHFEFVWENVASFCHSNLCALLVPTT